MSSCAKEDNVRPQGSPKDFFPTKVGTTWTYKISLGEVKPLNYEVVMWPRGKSGVTMATRGFFMGSLTGEKREFTLKIRVKGLASKQGVLKYPIGVELEIEEDELGVFDNCKQVFLAAASSGGFMAHMVIIKDRNSLGAPSSGSWGGWGEEDGYSMPIIFFIRDPGTQISMGENSSDSILFTGVSKLPVGNLKGLHFQRVVGATEKKPGEELSGLDQGFTEDTWFVRGKGLSYLVQRVNSKVSMTWTLVDFSD